MLEKSPSGTGVREKVEREREGSMSEKEKVTGTNKYKIMSP